jgi:hypothetical protein
MIIVNDGIDDNKDDDDKDDNKDEDDKTSKVYTIKRDVSLGSYGEAFLLGIYGLFFSVVFHRNLSTMYKMILSSVKVPPVAAC